MAEPVRARRLTDQEGQRLQQIVRRGKHGSVRVRRAVIIMAPASGTRVPAIARLVAADDDTVRDVIHAFNTKGLAALDPRWAGGRPRLISDEDIEVIVTARTRPEKLGQPFTRWSLRKLADYSAGRDDPVRIGRERLRQVLHARGMRATYHRTHGIRYFHGCYSPGDDQLWGGDPRAQRRPPHPGRAEVDPGGPARRLPAVRDHGQPGGEQDPAIRRWARRENVELCFTPTNASWANPIRGAIRARPHLRHEQLGLPEPPRADPPAPGLPALAQRPRPPPRRAGRPAPRTCPHPQRTPATLGPPQGPSRMIKTVNPAGPVDRTGESSDWCR
jgi:transposase